ncbi:acyl-CoA dehydrogenase family protein [Frankia gtarii]|uniref:acyl-CoA dehydrogenase family protein n=1 Tax=Frankia gtarii TaxID=2950102 RepID=UPI0021C22190|nr:acyl-CoA dehydrogenase family protein [Frankia gtarii]
MTAVNTCRAAPNTGSEIMAAVRAILPELRARSAEIEECRRLPDDVVELLRGTGVFRMGFAGDLGGPGLTSTQQTRVLEVLATGNASAAWCAMVGMDSGLFAEYLSPQAVRDMFPSLDLITAGMLAAAGRAERVPGGYRLSGRWSFGSGVTHADWVTAGAHVCVNGEKELSADGQPSWRVLMVRPDEVRLVGNWNSTGLAGSGSTDYEITDVFVPEEHTFSFAQARNSAGPLSTPDLQMRKMPGVPLGIATAALDHAREVVRIKVIRATGMPFTQDYRAQVVIGECAADLAVIRHAVYLSLDDRWDLLAAGTAFEDLTPDQRVATMLARANAFRGARSVVRRLYDLLTTSSVYRSSPMDGWLRDIETMCQHTVAQDQIVQSAGAFLVGGTPSFPLALGILDQPVATGGARR